MPLVEGGVLDASVAVLALAGNSDSARELREVLGRTQLHAPDLIDAEVGSVLRRTVVGGGMGPA